MGYEDYWLNKYPSLKNGMTEWDEKALSKIAPMDWDEKTIRYKMKQLGNWLEHVEKGAPLKSEMGREYQAKLNRWKVRRRIVNVVFLVSASLLVSWGFSVLPLMVKPTPEQLNYSLFHIGLGIAIGLVSSICLGLVTTEYRAEKEGFKWLTNALGLTKPLKQRKRKEIKKSIKSTRKVWLVYRYLPLCFVAAWLASVLVEESWLSTIIHGPLLRVFGFSPIEIPEENWGEAICYMLSVIMLAFFTFAFLSVRKEERGSGKK